jgi:hypothetical protein
MSIISRYEATELLKCYGDVHYFIENYVKIQHPIKGNIRFNMYQYQKNIVDIYEQSRFCIGTTARQMGITSLTSAYMLWKLTFESDFQIAVVVRNIASGQEIISRLMDAFYQLPDFLKQTVTCRNMREIKFENGSGIVALTANSPHTARGRSLNLVFFDDFAYTNRANAEEIWQTIVPCMSATNGRLIVTSAPSTTNTLFYRILEDALKGTNGFHPFTIRWDDHPNRDSQFKKTMIQQIGIAKFSQEYDCQFVDEI